MGKTINKFSDGSILEYDRGTFDEWCIYLTRPTATRHAPKDVEYFLQLQNFSKKYNAETIYKDFVSVYDMVGTKLTATALEHINKISSKYGGNALELEILFNIVYAGMVAEENKANTRLGKRIKRLGIHQTLLENMPASQAANFSRNKKWRDIDAECKQRGF